MGQACLEGISPRLFNLVDRAKEAAKLMLHQENPFYAWGIRYVGPVDGHDLPGLIHILEQIKELDGPTLLHIVTQKGKGYGVAEEDPIYWHGPPGFNPQKPEKVSKGYSWSAAFGDAVTELAHKEPRLFVITPAMREGSGLVKYSQTHPERYLDTGICEDVAATVAAGMALRGLKPVLAIYSTFMQRAYDQIIHDIAIENLPVVFAVDRAGIVGGDGATHNGVFDIAYLRTVPNVQIAAPKDALELRAMLKKALELGGPIAIRYARDNVEKAPEGALARDRVGPLGGAEGGLQGLYPGLWQDPQVCPRGRPGSPRDWRHQRPLPQAAGQGDAGAPGPGGLQAGDHRRPPEDGGLWQRGAGSPE
ncbi:MAG: hypothetical protein KatS3mg075_628 [Meiothermus sp.]|nr:MAG: hypothetical protein KatS3mg075_628 [Meiothermus sp.]